ncbi:hypothetical protein [Streptomyces pseudogriseolus]|uniref:hypothetical protein n=1 Tax=Streptomyces pseudogriseolus TaxID=36817 RepID=UPI003482F2DA
MTHQPDHESTADKAARLGMTPDEYRAHSHLAAVRQIRAALPGLYAETGLRVEAALAAPAAVSAAVAPPTNATHGLSVQHADALWDAVAIPGPRTPTYPEQHERVCRAVREILDELTPARDEVADQTALRDRLIDALDNAHHTHPCPELGDKTWSGCVHYDDAGRMLGVGVCHSERRADAVLAVLPQSVEDRVRAVCDQLLRSSVLADGQPHTDRERGVVQAVTRILAAVDGETPDDALRCMADEQADQTTPPAEPTAEEIARTHVTSLHMIGEQLSTIESWFWEHLADVRDAAKRQDGAAS